MQGAYTGKPGSCGQGLRQWNRQAPAGRGPAGKKKAIQARGQLSGFPARRRARRRPASSDAIASEARVSLISLRNRGPKKRRKLEAIEHGEVDWDDDDVYSLGRGQAWSSVDHLA